MRTVRKRLAKPLMPMLNSDGQPRTERDGNTEKGCHKRAVQQKTTEECIYAHFIIS